MSEEFKKYLEKSKFDKYLLKLNKKLKDKKIVVYGAGSFFNYIKENYDLSKLNIIGISDLKFDEEQEGQECLGYKIIPKNKIASYNPDCVLVATLRYIGIIEDFELNLFKDTKIRVYPFVRMPFWNLVKQIWLT